MKEAPTKFKVRDQSGRGQYRVQLVMPGTNAVPPVWGVLTKPLPEPTLPLSAPPGWTLHAEESPDWSITVQTGTYVFKEALAYAQGVYDSRHAL